VTFLRKSSKKFILFLTLPAKMIQCWFMVTVRLTPNGSTKSIEGLSEDHRSLLYFFENFIFSSCKVKVIVYNVLK